LNIHWQNYMTIVIREISKFLWAITSWLSSVYLQILGVYQKISSFIRVRMEAAFSVLLQSSFQVSFILSRFVFFFHLRNTFFRMYVFLFLRIWVRMLVCYFIKKKLWELRKIINIWGVGTGVVVTKILLLLFFDSMIFNFSWQNCEFFQTFLSVNYFFLDFSRW